jgi:hypothetical protein
MALDIDIDGFRRTGQHVDTAGSILRFTPGSDVPACGADKVSLAVMSNLNAWQSWLNQHLQAGAAQAFNAAQGIDGTAGAYEAQDAAAAATYPGGGHSHPAPATAPAAPIAAAPAPTAPPTLSPIPDVSTQSGQQLAKELEAGAGPGPATQAAAHWSAISGQAMAANAAFTTAQTQLLASGESQAHAPLLARLTRAIAWTDGVAGHASALAGGFTAAGGLYTTTKTAVGTSADWDATVEGYQRAASAGPLGVPQAQAYRVKLTGMQTAASSAAGTYTAGGQAASTPPGTLPDPGLDPNTSGTDSPTNPNNAPASDQNKPPNPDGQQADQEGSGMQDMMSSMMGAMSPLMSAASSPMKGLSQLGQMASQAASLASSAGKGAGSPIKPASLAGAHAGGAGGHGGGSGAKGAGLASGVHPASLTGSPSSSPASGPMKPGAPVKAAGASTGGGAGMMPAGHGKDGGKSAKVNSYEAPLPEVEEAGRAGVVGQTAKAEPVVDPDAKNAVKARLAARKKNLAGDDG